MIIDGNTLILEQVDAVMAATTIVNNMEEMLEVEIAKVAADKEVTKRKMKRVCIIITIVLIKPSQVDQTHLLTEEEFIMAVLMVGKQI